MLLSAVTESLSNGQEDNHSHSDEIHSKFTNRATLTSNRDKISICIGDYTQTSSSKSLSEKVINSTNSILEGQLKKHAKWKDSGYSKEQFEVVKGCSFTPFLLDDGNAHPVYSGKMNKKLDRIIDTPSKEQLGIFIVDPTVIEKHFKDAPDRWSPEEMLCENNECAEVTSGIYLTADELSGIDNKNLEYEIMKRFGFEQGHISAEQQEQIKNDEQQKELFIKSKKET
ncbi:hypothetical protein H8B09_02525 [Paenibacillus sp. PR3]|uniref:Uncharacterized protein n=1 Tax=Paenibacillus terricola TaxID=2763503 RepID=A0ABR8MNU4_9BACL|nr:hypothetical protein [Paenibacillus terricola]MBD3917613.1 hypothetical protein [Paenibacillus terricola]